MTSEAIDQHQPTASPTRNSAARTGGVSVDAAIEPCIADALAALDGRAPLLAGMIRYHLGYLEPDLTPAAPSRIASSRGKRLRPAVALLSCAVFGGQPSAAGPLGAAVELLHNFTLIHDDIQDRSATRRHRPTVWQLWGVEQGINAGDALFASAHLPLARLPDWGVPAHVTVRLIEAFNRMTIEIVAGQVLDLGFEGRNDVTPDAYLDMIAGKTAAIVRFAAWAGALLGAADERAAAQFGEFGLALGLGYQMRDDALGIWGVSDETGKATADDIRRRKQSLPIVLLRAHALPDQRADLEALYQCPTIDDAGVARILMLLEEHDVAAEMTRRTASFHRDARAALLSVAPSGENTPRDELLRLIDSLATRRF